MNGFSLLLAALTMGVDYGWQPSSDGQMEYIVQIEPVTLIAMREGQEVVSQIDPQMRNARRFRIHVGTEMVPRRGTGPAQLPATGITAAQLPQAPGVQFGWQPISREQLEFIVQIVPERMTTLRTGDDIVGEMPIDLPNVGRIRIVTGNAAIPRQGFQGAAVQPLALGQPPATNGLPAAMIAPPRNSDPALNYGASNNGQYAANGSSWASPNNTNNAWSTTANATVPNQNSALYDQQRAAQAGQQRYQDPQTAGQDWRSSWNTNSSSASAADPRLTSFPQVPPTQSLYDANRYREQNYGYPASTTQPTYTAGQSPNHPTQGNYASAPSSYGTWPNQVAAGTNPTNPNWTTTAGRPNGLPQTPSVTGTPNTAGYGAADGSQGNSWNSAAPNNSGWPQQRVAGQTVDPRTGVPNNTWSDPNSKYRPNQAELAKDRPWGALTVAVFLLFASIGGNLYLGWIAARIYRLYLDLADELEDKDRQDVAVEQPVGEDRWKERRKRRRAILGV